MHLRLPATLVLALAVAAPLQAQSHHHRPGPYGGPVDREGFLIGFSVSAGAVGPDPCHDCGVVAGADLRIGAMATPEVAVMLEGGGLGRDNLHHLFLVAAAQWWPDPYERFWLRGGLGIGTQGTDEESDVHRDDAYPTVLGALGFEVVRSGRFTIDVQLQGAATAVPHHWGRSVSLGIGFSWY